MDTIHCRLSAEHTAIWACACDQPPLNFCSSCLLTHLTSPGTHTPTPLGEAGPYTCGKCKGQVKDAMAVNYPISLCDPCMQQWRVTVAAHQALPGDIQEAALKVQGEEVVRKIQAAAPQTSFKSIIYEKRVELMMHLTNALEDMNNIEEVKQRAQNAERQLEERRLEIDRIREEKDKLLQLQQGGVSQVHVESSLLTKMEEMFEKMEHKQTKLKELEDQCAKLASERDLLIYQNGTLSETMSKLQENFNQARLELANQQELKNQVETLSKEVEKLNSQNFSAQVKESITSLTEYLAKAMAEKMTDVLPLVAHLKLDESWLDEESAESFLELARLGVQDLIDIKSIRQISRVCAQVAKQVEPCNSVASFVTSVNKLLRGSSEKGKGLVKRLELIYHKMLGHQSARNVLRGFLELPTQDTNIVDEAIHLVADLTQVLDTNELSGFSIAMTHYLGSAGDRGKKLLSRLSSLPIQWPEHLRERGIASMKTLLATVVNSQFNKPYLKLSKVLASYGQHDPELLLAFTLRACDALLTKNLEPDLHSLFKKLVSYIQFTAKFPEQESSRRIEQSFLTMKLLLPGAKANKDQLELLISALTAMESGTKASQVVDSLLDALQKINAWEPSLSLGFAVLDWMFDRRGGERVEFTGPLLKWLLASDPRVLNESVQQSVSLLKALKTLSQALSVKAIGELEGLMDSGVELPKVRTLIVILATVLSKIPVAAKITEFISNLLSILDPGPPDVRGEIADRYTALIQKGTLFDGVLATSQCHVQLKRRGSAPDNALRFVADVLDRFIPGGDNTELYSLLKEMTTVLTQEHQAYAVVFKSCEVYVRSRSRSPMDSRPLTFCACILRQLQRGVDPVSIENFLKEFLNILAQEKKLYSVAFELGNLYTKMNTAAASKFLREQLAVLRGLAVEGELETLLQDIQTLANLTSEEIFAFIKTIFQMCVDKPAEIVPLTRALKTFVRQA